MQLADDPLIAPARVLTRESEQHRSDLAADRRSSAATGVRPAPGNKPPMPPKQCRWRDEERSPARPRQQLACCGKEDSIGHRQLGATRLSAQHRELVSEHDDLECLDVLRAGTATAILSINGEMIITAAHCVADIGGDGHVFARIKFAPESLGSHMCTA